MSREFEFLKPPTKPGLRADILIAPGKIEHFKKLLQRVEIQWRVTVENVQRDIEKEKVSAVFKSSGTGFDYTSYQQFDSMMKYLEELSKKHPELLNLEQIGTTHEGRPLTVAKISTGGNKKPGFWIDGGIHAREWISPATVMYFIEQLVENEDSEWLRENYDWYILPVLNPDGYEYSHRNDRFWRKNRAPPLKKSESCCIGVDLNRNFDWHFGGVSTKNDTCYDLYPGPEAFSEPETRALRNFVLAKNNSLKIFLSLHSYGQMWLIPFGHEQNAYPDNYEELKRVADISAEALRSVHGTEYVVGTGANILYSASGCSDDWAKGVAEIEYVYLLELRPPNNVPGKLAFTLPPDQILPTAEETWKGVASIAKEAFGSPKITTPEDTSSTTIGSSETTTETYISEPETTQTIPKETSSTFSSEATTETPTSHPSTTRGTTIDETDFATTFSSEVSTETSTSEPTTFVATTEDPECVDDADGICEGLGVWDVRSYLCHFEVVRSYCPKSCDACPSTQSPFVITEAIASEPITIPKETSFQTKFLSETTTETPTFQTSTTRGTTSESTQTKDYDETSSTTTSIETSTFEPSTSVETTPGPECVDLSVECSTWWKYYCSYSKEVRKRCPKTCGTCPSSKSTFDPITEASEPTQTINPKETSSPTTFSSEVSTETSTSQLSTTRGTTSESTETTVSENSTSSATTSPTSTSDPSTSEETTRPGGRCRDRAWNCRDWKHHCNYESVRESCPKTCGTCPTRNFGI